MSCTVEQRQAARAALEAVAADPRVPRGGTSLIAPHAGPRPTWVLTVVVEGDAVPGALLSTLGGRGLALVDIERTPDHVTVTAEVPR